MSLSCAFASHRAALRRALVVAALVATTLTVVATPSPAASADKWGKVFCTELGTWRDDLLDAQAQVQAQLSGLTPALARTALVDLLDEMASITTSFEDGVRDVGAPDVRNGKQIQAAIVEGIAGVEASLRSFRSQLAQLPTTDAVTFRAALQPIVSQLDTISTPFETAMDTVSRLDRRRDLEKKALKVKACRTVLG